MSKTTETKRSLLAMALKQKEIENGGDGDDEQGDAVEA